MARWRHLGGGWGALGLMVALMLLVGLLPPDTSLSEMRKAGVMKACVPTSYPPLVTGHPARPGIDIEILKAVADDIGVDLLLDINDAMGRDFNPGNWGITRANCQVLGGGIVDSTLTRSFLDISPPYARTSWAVIAPAQVTDIRGLTIGALTHVSGLDRIGLARYLRDRGVVVRIMRDQQELTGGIASGALDAGMTEALLAGQIAADNQFWIARLPEELGGYELVFGLWKGDLTLKRAFAQALDRLDKTGALSDILSRYVAAPAGSVRFPVMP